jgi:biopolymer transport protein ExbD
MAAGAPRKKRKRKGNRAFSDDFQPEFQVAPMADLLFVLLVFFMSITTVEVLRKENVDLPVAKDSTENKQKGHQVVVNVLWSANTHTGTIRIDDRAYPDPEALVPILSQQISQDPVVRVLIRADQEAEYKFISEIMKACSESHIADVTFAVLNQETGAKPAAAPTGI